MDEKQRQTFATVCGDCGHQDRHSILFEHQHTTDRPDDLCYQTDIQVVQCDECGEVTIWAGINEDFVVSALWNEGLSQSAFFKSIHQVVFPSLYVRSKWPFSTPKESLDRNTLELLHEAIQAREAGLHLSAAVMYRGALESLLRNRFTFPETFDVASRGPKGGKSKSKKVDGLFDYIECLKEQPDIAGKRQEGLLALLESSAFDLFRWVGNVAAHGDTTRSKKNLAAPEFPFFGDSVRAHVNRKTSDSLTKLFNLVLEAAFRDISAEASQFVKPHLKK